MESLIANQPYFINRGNDAPWPTANPGSVDNDFFLVPWEEIRHSFSSLPGQLWRYRHLPDDIRLQAIFHILQARYESLL